jgi:hypothetical protein
MHAYKNDATEIRELNTDDWSVYSFWSHSIDSKMDRGSLIKAALAN